MYAGFLSAGKTVGIHQSEMASSIFSSYSNYQIQLSRTVSSVYIFNALGQQMKSLKNVNQINLSDLQSGIYIIRADNEIKKFFR